MSITHTPAGAIRPADITRALRALFPRPVSLRTSPAGPGRFTITLPATCARQLSLAVTRDIADSWLTRHLSTQVSVEGCEFPKRRYGDPARAIITISTGTEGGQR